MRANNARIRRGSEARGSVVTYSPGPEFATVGHGALARDEIARRLAALMDYAYDGEYDPARRYAGTPYFGCSAFAMKDALRAGGRLLDCGGVRIKPATALAGLGQFRATNVLDLVRALDEIGAEEMARSGVVVEQCGVGNAARQSLTMVRCGSDVRDEVAGSVPQFRRRAAAAAQHHDEQRNGKRVDDDRERDCRDVAHR